MAMEAKVATVAAAADSVLSVAELAAELMEVVRDLELRVVARNRVDVMFATQDTNWGVTC